MRQRRADVGRAHLGQRRRGIGDTGGQLGVLDGSGHLGPKPIVRQGNLDPLLLMIGGPALDDRIREICTAMRGLLRMVLTYKRCLMQKMMAGV